MAAKSWGTKSVCARSAVHAVDLVTPAGTLVENLGSQRDHILFQRVSDLP